MQPLTHILRKVSSVLAMDTWSNASNLSTQDFTKGLNSSQWYMCCFLRYKKLQNAFNACGIKYNARLQLKGLPVLLLVYTVGNDQVKWEVSCKHFIHVLGQFSEHSTISVVTFTLKLQYQNNNNHIIHVHV